MWKSKEKSKDYSKEKEKEKQKKEKKKGIKRKGIKKIVFTWFVSVFSRKCGSYMM